MASCQSGCGGWQPVRVIPAGGECGYDAADSQRKVACERNLASLPARAFAADSGGPAIGELSGLLHLQRGGPTGPGADPKPVLAGVVRQSSLASGLPSMMLVKVQQLFRKAGLVKLGHASQGRTKVSEQSESQSQQA